MKHSCIILWVAFVASVSSQGMYELIAKENAQKNLVLSPFSIETALSMVYMGAEGGTAQELRQALKLPVNKQEVARKYRELVSNLQSTLTLANRIYVNEKYSLRPEFNQAVGESFGAVAQPIDLSSGGQKAAKIINQWVLDHTGGRIKDIVSPGSLNPAVMVVVVNALYFKGQWGNPFHRGSTKKADFHLTSQRSISVLMMSQHGHFLAGDFPELQAKVLELPYENSNLLMVIFLPYTVDGLSALEEKIAEFSGILQPAGVAVRLPKFRIEFSISLKRSLEKMGIRDLFTGNSNLKRLFLENLGAKVDEVSHKAFVEVDEDGTEAASATSIEGLFVSGYNYKLNMNFTADHPFAFIIRDEKNIYFQGHVVEPLKEL